MSAYRIERLQRITYAVTVGFSALMAVVIGLSI